MHNHEFGHRYKFRDCELSVTIMAQAMENQPNKPINQTPFAREKIEHSPTTVPKVFHNRTSAGGLHFTRGSSSDVSPTGDEAANHVRNCKPAMFFPSVKSISLDWWIINSVPL